MNGIQALQLLLAAQQAGLSDVNHICVRIDVYLIKNPDDPSRSDVKMELIAEADQYIYHNKGSKELLREPAYFDMGAVIEKLTQQIKEYGLP